MAKKPKKPAAAKITPAKMGYLLSIENLREKYDEYASGEAECDHFTTPAKQKKVAVQIAKYHNRLVTKSKLTQFEPLDEELD